MYRCFQCLKHAISKRLCYFLDLYFPVYLHFMFSFEYYNLYPVSLLWNRFPLNAILLYSATSHYFKIMLLFA